MSVDETDTSRVVATREIQKNMKHFWPFLNWFHIWLKLSISNDFLRTYFKKIMQENIGLFPSKTIEFRFREVCFVSSKINFLKPSAITSFLRDA